MAGNSIARTFFLAVITICTILYVFFYITKKAYLKEYFQSNEDSYPSVSATTVAEGSAMIASASGNYNPLAERTQIDAIANNNSGEVIMRPAGETITLTPGDTPYAREPIEDVDDYEYNMVYMNESNTALSKDLRQKLMRQYPMHWTTYPPSSAQFQAGYQESFQNAAQDVPDDAVPYQNISGATMSPPDMAVMEREERKILQTYAPEFPPKGVTYDERDANKLIKKIYDAKGLIPQVNHREGTNVYEIVGTRRKNETVVYEDDVQARASNGAVADAGENTIQVPVAVTEMATGSNPWQYTAWTPGLERVFAPSEPTQNWEAGN
jgi:hypothetical protein